MELDEIKKMWQEIDTLKEKQQINENRIKEMLKNEGKSALAKLLRYAKFYTIAIIPLGLFLCLLSYKFFQAGGYYFICPLVLLFLCIATQPLELYLYRMLKGIDFSSMSVKEVSERILKYQDVIQKCQMYGIIVFFVYMSIWYYLYYKLVMGSEVFWPLIIFMIAMVLTGLIVIPILYRTLYFNNINRIKESLQELKEFENN
jgi:hypothetical protein